MKNKIFREQGKVISNKKIQGNYFKIVLNSPRIAGAALPGQFINVKVSAKTAPLLRRPFSIHRVRDSKLDILYEVLGEGSKILSGRKPKENLDIIGPLGSGFKADASTPVLVGGGMGVAPLLFLAERLSGSAGRILIGGKNKKQLLCEKEFQNLGYNVKISTDDGSRGVKGKVTDLLKHLLSTIDHRPSTIYACGPRPMLKEICYLAKKYKVAAQISLDEHMACGIGACLGCVVETTNGYQRVCKDGPVFEAEKIIWD